MKIVKIRSIDEKLDLFDKVQGDGLWIVSDLQSKLYLQRRRLGGKSFCNLDSILRAQELWAQLAISADPSIQIVHDDIVKCEIKEIIERLERRDLDKPGSADTLFQYLTYFYSTFSTEGTAEVIREWFKDNPQAIERWGQWFSGAATLFVEFKRQKKIGRSWLHGFLLGEHARRPLLNQPLYFDFGPHLVPGEAELIRSLAEHNSVTVIVPDDSGRALSESAFRSYEALGLARIKSKGPPQREKTNWRRFSTMIAEVKDAVAQVRAWLDAGVAAPDIAVIAPDIGLYWPSLALYFNVEGVPVSRSQGISLQTYSDVQKWLSELRIRLSSYDLFTLKSAIYLAVDDSTDLPISQKDFDYAYSKVFVEADLSRRAEVGSHFRDSYQLNKETPIEFGVFVLWAKEFWPDEGSSHLFKKILNRAYSEIGQTTLRPRMWLDYLTRLVSRIEHETTKSQVGGVACLDVSSAEYSRSTYIYAMGLSDSALRRDSDLTVLDSDVVSLADSTGIHLPFPTSRDQEFDLQWVLSDTNLNSVVLSFSETNFDGEPLSPSATWLEQNPSVHAKANPLPSRWDEIQQAAPNSILTFLGSGVGPSESLWKAIEPEILRRPVELFDIAGASQISRVSPSSIESYIECPFVYYTRYILKLDSVPPLDLDLDHMRRGRLAHALASRMFKDGQLRTLSEDERKALVVDVVDSQEKIEFVAPELRLKEIQKWTNWLQEFVQFERAWRENYPDTQTRDVEMPVDGWIYITSGELSKTAAEAPEKSLKFVGRVDRVDRTHDGRAAIIDYKSTTGALSNWGRWVEKNELQLALYSLAVEAQLYESSLPLEVVTAIYFSIRDFEREKGFVILERGETLMPISNRKKNILPQAQKEEFLAGIKTTVGKALGRLTGGEFTPMPLDEKTCDTCDWNKVCRAPHLI